MQRRLVWMGLAFLILGIFSLSEASLVGPWFRYPCEDLGFQMPVADDWRVTPVPHGLVFAIQYAPQPYVRVAVGRVSEGASGMEPLIASRLKQMRSQDVHRSGCQVDGRSGIEIEGSGEAGPFRDVFIAKGGYVYWISFAAQNQKLWPQYSQTFDIIIDEFHFI